MLADGGQLSNSPDRGASMDSMASPPATPFGDASGNEGRCRRLTVVRDMEETRVREGDKSMVCTRNGVLSRNTELAKTEANGELSVLSL